MYAIGEDFNPRFREEATDAPFHTDTHDSNFNPRFREEATQD